MLRGILTIGGWTMASRVLGFLRDVILADLLGAGPVADAFFVATRLPNLFRRLFGEGAFNAAFVPAFSGLLAAEGPEAAQIFAQEAFAVMAVWLFGLTALFELSMPAVMTVFAAGFTTDPAKFALVVQLARITFPYMPLICLTALLSGVLNGLDRFAAAAAAPVIYNVTSILFMLGLVGLVPTVGHAAAWGLSVSGIFQLALVMWAVRQAGMRLHLAWPRLTAQMRLLMRRMGPGLLGAGVVQLNLAIDSLIATLLPAGTVAVLNYADRLNQLPLAIIGTAVGTALLPTLSRQALSGQAEAAVTTLNRSLEYALAITLPATMALIAIPVPIVAVLFGRGAMTAEDVQLTAGSLAAFGTGLPAFVMVKLLVSGFFARGDTATPMKIGTAAVVLNLGLNLLFMHPLQHLGPPLASSVAAWLNVGVLGAILMRRGHLGLDARLLRVLPRMILAGAIMVGVLLWLNHTVFAPLADTRLRWLALAALVGGGILAYGIAGQTIRAFDLRELAGQSPRRPKPAGTGV
jgi:putative peptidoglycan lipid II flippase